MRRALAVALVFGLTAPAAQAAMFDGLFAFAEPKLAEPEPPPFEPAPEPQAADAPPLAAFAPRSDAGVCIAAIRQAEATHGIPSDLLLAIGLQEAGMSYKGSMTIWPWSLNVEGRGVRFDTRPEAEAFLAAELAQGKRSIDVGCLQINLRWHPDAFASPSAGFDPARNADYAARFLRSLYLDTGDWLEAAGHYHSATPALKSIYLAGIERHLSRLDRDAGTFDALARHAPLMQGGGVMLAAGVMLDGPVVRRLNPLHAPVRQARSTGAARGQFRRMLQGLPPAAQDGFAAQLDAMPQPALVRNDSGGGWGGDAGSLFAPPAPPAPPAAEIVLTPGPDGLIP